MKNVRSKAKAGTVPDPTAEQKIKAAARKVFMTKGYAGARTRDIADEAGINLALLNYYFRSKEKLFDLIMLETLQHFMGGVHAVLADEHTDLKSKTETIASTYVDLLLQNPDLPIFIMSEIRLNPDRLAQRLGAKGFFSKSRYFTQLREAGKANKSVNPLHYFMNTMAMIVFPFIARPLLINIADMGKGDFEKLMNERKKLIARWVEAMLKAS